MVKNNLSSLLLDWYFQNGRDLPWRVKGGAHPDPYVILVSEFMLQQTTVKTVIPYFAKFMQRFPTIQSLAKASIDEVYQYWQGLGYYSRARSLHSAAQMIINDFGGRFPENRTDVLKLKGVGEYTASSFLALAFNQPETVVDGNVIRIICRMYHLTDSVDEIKEDIIAKAVALTNRQNPADYASAIMDLGAMVCTPKNPQCLICPWHNACLSKGLPDIEKLPNRRRLEKKEKTGFVYLIYDSSGKILIRQRSEKGLLSGLFEFPWGEQPLFSEAKPTGTKISHVFTHFRLTLQIYVMQSDQVILNGKFINPEELPDYPVSTLMKKVFNQRPK